MSEELKPCPFCGSTAIRMPLLDNPNKGIRFIGCMNCCVVSFRGMTNEQAIAVWNTRAREQQ